MNRFRGFVIKEFYHIFRDVRTLIILFGIPVAQLVLFGYVLTTEISNVKIGVLDYSKDDVTVEIVNKLLGSGYFELAANINNPDEIDALFKSGKVKEVLVFENNFGRNLLSEGGANLQIIADASDPNMATLVSTYSNAIVMDYLRPKAGVQNGVATKVRMLFNENLKAAYNFVPGIIAVILILISALMTSVTIAREKEMGTMEILLASPLKPIQIILGKVTPYLILSVLDAVLVLWLGNVVFDVPIKGSMVILFGEIVLYVLLALSLGVFISTKAPNQMIAMAISAFALMLPTILLSGFIFPIKNMPLVLQYLSLIMPPRWFIEIVRGVMLKGAGLDVVLKPTLILIGITIVILGLAVKNFKIRLE